MPTAPAVRPLAAADHPAFLALNNAAVPHVNRLAPDDLLKMLDNGAAGLVVATDGPPAAIALTFDERCGAYASPNYQWFRARYDRFTYLDRIVVAPEMRGRGLGHLLYEAVFAAAARAGSPIVGCEVNERPPNPGSLALHRRLGFAEVGRQETEAGAKSVVLLARSPSRPGTPDDRSSLAVCH